MIITRLTGGLGNQMFQYAAGKSLALAKSTELKLDVRAYENDYLGLRKYELNYFRISGQLASAREIGIVRKTGVRSWPEMLKPIHQRSVYREPHFHFDSRFFDASENAYLEGYWQSEKYFVGQSEVFRQEFTLKDSIDPPNARLADQIDRTESVSLHIRRGDYLTNPHVAKLHPACGLDYYEKAIAFFETQLKNPHFYVFSDDLLWARANLPTRHPTTFVDNPGKNHQDLVLMSYCTHQITANSSFSWWAAWLNRNPDKKIVCPRNWFSAADRDTRDLLPQAWIKT